MKRFFYFIVCCLCMAIVTPVTAEVPAEKKEKKEKKGKKKKDAYVWKMPALTGDKDFDDYLNLCDSLNSKIENYKEDIVFYEVAEIHIVDENGEKDIRYHVVDSMGNLRSANKAFIQNFDLIMAYPFITLDMTNLGLATTLATTSLANLGLNSLTYAKYLKAGPILIGRGGKEMKEIYKSARHQAKMIKTLKEGKIDDVKALHAEVNAGSIDAGTASLKVIEMKKADYETAFEKITKEDNENPITQNDIPEEVI